MDYILQYNTDTTPPSAKAACNEVVQQGSSALLSGPTPLRSPRFGALTLAVNLRAMAAAIDAGASVADLILDVSRAEAAGLVVRGGEGGPDTIRMRLTPALLRRAEAAGFNGGDLGAWLVDRAERARPNATPPDPVAHRRQPVHQPRRAARGHLARRRTRRAVPVRAHHGCSAGGHERDRGLHEARAAAVAKDAEIRRLTDRITEAERERDDARNGANLAADRANRHHAEVVRLRDPILTALLAEVTRAEELHGPLPIGAPSPELRARFVEIETCARIDLDLLPPTALAILAEEVGELGRATTPEEQREEAIQVMAVCYRLVRALS